MSDDFQFPVCNVACCRDGALSSFCCDPVKGPHPPPLGTIMPKSKYSKCSNIKWSIWDSCHKYTMVYTIHNEKDTKYANQVCHPNQKKTPTKHRERHLHQKKTPTKTPRTPSQSKEYNKHHCSPCSPNVLEIDLSIFPPILIYALLSRFWRKIFRPKNVMMMMRVTMGMRVMALLPRRSLATGTAGKQTLCSRWSSTTSGQSWSSTTSGQSWKQRREHWIKLKLKAGCLESCGPVVFQETFLSFHNMPMLRCSPAWKQNFFVRSYSWKSYFHTPKSFKTPATQFLREGDSSVPFYLQVRWSR